MENASELGILGGVNYYLGHTFFEKNDALLKSRPSGNFFLIGNA